MPVSSEERYQEWLDRLEIPIENMTDIATLQSYLKDEFGITGDAQIAALWSSTQVSADFAEHGIRAVTVTYPWGKELRYGVQGMAGLWGLTRIQEIRAGEGW